MTIERNGTTIELTDSEIEKAYRERKQYYHKCDLIHKIKEYIGEDDWEEEIFNTSDDPVEIGRAVTTANEVCRRVENPDWMEGLVDEFESALSDNDPYWECYWATAECVIEDIFKEEYRKGA